MKPLIIFTSVLSLSGTASFANSTDITFCLQNNIQVEVLGVDDNNNIIDKNALIDNREIKVRITNELNIPLGGVWVDFEIWAEERPLPIYSASFRDAATIDGALLSDESIDTSDFHFMDDREVEIARKSDNLTVKAYVRNAADIKMNGFLDSPQMGSWSNQLTNEKCQAK